MPHPTEGSSVVDESAVKQRAAEQRQRFRDKHGYPAVSVPEMWVGQDVTMSILGGRGGDHYLGSVKVTGVLEALREDGVVISNDDGPSFMSRSVVLRMELDEPEA
jgi:hypothetical protein